MASRRRCSVRSAQAGSCAPASATASATAGSWAYSGWPVDRSGHKRNARKKPIAKLVQATVEAITDIAVPWARSVNDPATHPRPELEEQRLALATHLLTTMEEYE